MTFSKKLILKTKMQSFMVPNLIKTYILMYPFGEGGSWRHEPCSGSVYNAPSLPKGRAVVGRAVGCTVGQTLDSQIVEDRAGSSQAGRQPCRHYATSMTFRVNGCHDQQTTMTAIVNHFNYSSLARPSKGHYGLYQIHAIHFYSVLCQHIATGQEGLKGP